MIAVGVYVCVVLLYLIYEYFLARNTAQRILLLLFTAVFSASAFVVAWDIVWIQYLCGVQTILEVLNLVATIEPSAFPFHVVPLARTLYFTGILVCAIEHNTAGMEAAFANNGSRGGIIGAQRRRIQQPNQPTLRLDVNKLESYEQNHERHQYRTDTMHQWLVPLLSPACILYTTGCMLFGSLVTWWQDYTGHKLMDEIVVNNLALVLSVFMGLQLQALYSKYNEMQLLLAMLSQTSNGLLMHKMRRVVIDVLLAGSTPMPEAEFIKMFHSVYTESESIPIGRRYEAYCTLYTNVRATHNSALNTVIWWMTAVVCAFCVPSQLNEVDDNNDFSWAAPSLVLMVIFWSVYSTMKLYEDILRETHIWAWPSLRPSDDLIRPQLLYRIFKIRRHKPTTDGYSE